jgi:hypothetical protein
MADIIKVLQQIAELDFWTRCPTRDAQGDDLAYPPFIFWRHKHPSPELAAFFRDAIQSFPGETRWELIISERNWVLLPARIKEHEQANQLLGGRHAAKELKQIDPEFGKLANAELSRLAEHIAKLAANPVAA